MHQIIPTIIVATVAGGVLVPLNPVHTTLAAGVAYYYLKLNKTTPEPIINITHLTWLCAFFSSLFASTLLAKDTERAFMLNAFALPAWFLSGVIAMGFNSDSIRWLHRSIALIVTTLGIMALISIHPLQVEDPSTWIKHLQNTYISVPNDLLYGAILAGGLAEMAASDGARAHQWFARLGLVIWFAVAIFYRSTAVFLALTIHCIFFLKVINIVWSAFAVMLGMCIEAFLGFPMSKKIVTLSSFWSRVPLWLASWQMFIDAPLFGQGAGSFFSIGHDYIEKAWMVLPNWLLKDPRMTPWPHNIYLETLAERGILGFLVLVGFLATIARSALRKFSSPDRLSPHTKVVGSMISAVMVTGLFDGSIDRFWFWVILAVLSGMATLEEVFRNDSPRH